MCGSSTRTVARISAWRSTRHSRRTPTSPREKGLRAVATTTCGRASPSHRRRTAPPDLFLAHLLTLVCRGNQELFQWLVQWLAHMVQRPEELAGTAVALRGPQGSGKTLVGEVMKVILGDRLYTKVSRPEELTGRFNAHHYGRVLIQVEEGFWAGDKRAEGALKDMITAPTRQIERKFMDPIELPNYGRFLITSNNAWVVPAGHGERRFAVFDVDGARANDFEYFGALREQMFEAGGCARFYHYLLNEVVIDWELIRRPPSTRALLDQQARIAGRGRPLAVRPTR